MKDRLIVVPTSKKAEQRLIDKLGLIVHNYELEEILEDKLRNLEKFMEYFFW